MIDFEINSVARQLCALVAHLSVNDQLEVIDAARRQIATQKQVGDDVLLGLAKMLEFPPEELVSKFGVLVSEESDD